MFNLSHLFRNPGLASERSQPQAQSRAAVPRELWGGLPARLPTPFYLILARKALPDLGVNVLHGSELWVSPQPSASGALQQLLCFQLPPPPVSARCVHPEEEFAATRHLSFPSVVAFASPF